MKYIHKFFRVQHDMFHVMNMVYGLVDCLFRTPVGAAGIPAGYVLTYFNVTAKTDTECVIEIRAHGPCSQYIAHEDNDCVRYFKVRDARNPEGLRSVLRNAEEVANVS